MSAFDAPVLQGTVASARSEESVGVRAFLTTDISDISEFTPLWGSDPVVTSKTSD
jgi:hypothetical protein